MIADRKFIRDKDNPFHWFVCFGDSCKGFAAPELVEIFSDYEADNLIEILKEHHINAKKIPRAEASTIYKTMWPFHVIISFDNEEDEALFMLKAAK